MTEKEFLENVSYDTNEHHKEMIVYYNDEIIATLSFENVEDKLNDDDYCTVLAEEVALQSSFAKLVEYPLEKNYDNFESCRGYEE